MGVFNWLLLSMLVAYCVLLFSFYIFGLFSSVNTRTVYNHKIYFPDGNEWKWAFDNFVKVFNSFVIDDQLLSDGTMGYANFLSMTINSFVFAGIAALSRCVATCLVAYGAARFPYRFSKWVYTFVIVTMVIPIIGGTPSLIVIIKALGLYEKLSSVALNAFSFHGFYFLVIYSVMQGLSKDYAEAAYLDGASEWTVFLKITLPTTTPILAVNALNAFIHAYSSWEWAFLVCQKESHWTLAVWMYQMSQTFAHQPWCVMAGFVLVSIPTAVVFLACQKIILRGIVLPSMK